jgi:hypothetical protein
MKRKRVEMTYLLFSQRLTYGSLLQPAWLHECTAASTTTRSGTTHDLPFRMPFADAESFAGAPAEYDIPVMPRQSHHHWWAAHSHTSLREGNETRKIEGEDVFADLSVSPFIVSHWDVLEVPRRFNYRRIKSRLYVITHEIWNKL